jgi:hypothetical protein
MCRIERPSLLSYSTVEGAIAPLHRAVHLYARKAAKCKV